MIKKSIYKRSYYGIALLDIIIALGILGTLTISSYVAINTLYEKYEIKKTAQSIHTLTESIQSTFKISLKPEEEIYTQAFQGYPELALYKDVERARQLVEDETLFDNLLHSQDFYPLPVNGHAVAPGTGENYFALVIPVSTQKQCVNLISQLIDQELYLSLGIILGTSTEISAGNNGFNTAPHNIYDRYLFDPTSVGTALLDTLAPAGLSEPAYLSVAHNKTASPVSYATVCEPLGILSSAQLNVFVIAY